MHRITRKSLFLPDFITGSVLEMQTDALKKLGITHIVFDIDETVVPKKHNELTPPYVTFFKNLKKQGFTVLIGSNTKRDITAITKHMKATVVPPTRFSFKPFKGYYRRVIEASGAKPEQIAMVGDKVLNDVIGANNAGLHTVLVKPYVRRQGVLYTLYARLYVDHKVRIKK